MKSLSVRLGKFFGIEVFIHWSFWILIVWIFLMNLGGGREFKQGLSGVLFVLALFVCVVLHEFGHALTARRFGVSTKNITLYPIGGVASLEGLPEKPAQELLVAIVGPLINIFIAAILWIYLNFSGQVPDWSAMQRSENVTDLPFLWSLFFANIILAVFNLIPAFPMDGGRALRSLLWFWTDRARATQIAAGLGQFLAVIFVFLGFFYNFWLVIIGLFIFLGAGGEAAYEKTKAALTGLLVRDALMKKFTVLKPDDTLGRAVDALLNSQETEFVVADGETGKPVGLLTRNEIIRGLSEQGKGLRSPTL
jgi:Zn-dependent protease